jgi:hypothetical protein
MSSTKSARYVLRTVCSLSVLNETHALSHTLSAAFAVAQPVLKDVLAGYNGAILAYGQTGAGKTHTLLNNAGGKPAEAGLLPRTVAALFVYVGADAGHVYTVDAAAFQIYNEQVDDLLCEDRNQNCNLPVKAGGDVQNLTWVPCKTVRDTLRCVLPRCRIHESGERFPPWVSDSSV